MTDDTKKLIDLLDGIWIGMLTTFGPNGPRSFPMARQEVDPTAELWFITARDTQHTADLQLDPRAVLTFSSSNTWVALNGTATIVDDDVKLKELWNTFAEAWMPEGPEDSNAVLLRFDVERGEYWDTPGGRVASLISLAKTKLTGETYDADRGVINP